MSAIRIHCLYHYCDNDTFCDILCSPINYRPRRAYEVTPNPSNAIQHSKQAVASTSTHKLALVNIKRWKSSGKHYNVNIMLSRN